MLHGDLATNEPFYMNKNTLFISLLHVGFGFRGFNDYHAFCSGKARHATMPDLTSEFRVIVSSKEPRHTEKPRRKRKTFKDDASGQDDSMASYDLFTKEAYRILQHITSLKQFLISIRRAYLDDYVNPRSTRPAATSLKLEGSSSLFSMFPNNVSSLTDQERDEIDFQAKILIRRCMDRIKELEEAEKLRQRQEQERQGAILSRLFFLNNATTVAQDTLTLHRSSITWFLNKRLTEVSELQKSQQEIRLNRALEKTDNQLFRQTTVKQPMTYTEDEEEEEKEQTFDTMDQELPQELIQVLEKENSAMLEEFNHTLDQVRNAEKALLEISTLQNQLTEHLAAQTAQTDRLYADSIASTERIEQGNLQLIGTREHNRGTRKFVLFLLIMASLVLLFLDWYS